MRRAEGRWASRFLAVQLASHGIAALIFDKRGVGLSERVGYAPTLDQTAADIRAVMDAAGVERAAVFAEADGNPMALTFAAVHPERVTHLFLHHPFARLTASAYRRGATIAASLTRFSRSAPVKAGVRSATFPR